MNTPADPARDDPRHAEYVLGVLDATARAAVEQEMRNDPRVAATVLLWQQRLSPLADDVPAVTPAAHVWTRISATLGHAAPTQPHAPSRLWDNLRLWRWVAIGASAVAATALVALVDRPWFAPTVVAPGYRVATLVQDNGVAGWTATLDRQRRTLVVVAATPATFASDRSTQLWLIAPGRKPQSLGLVARDGATTIDLTPALFAQAGAQALLAVSVEPPAGSPTGQPTGPVVAKGAIGGA